MSLVKGSAIWPIVHVFNNRHATVRLRRTLHGVTVALLSVGYDYCDTPVRFNTFGLLNFPELFMKNIQVLIGFMNVLFVAWTYIYLYWTSFDCNFGLGGFDSHSVEIALVK